MVITCGFCGTRFEEDRAQPACVRCPLGAHCGLARCPACGFENPRVPSWIERLRDRLRAARGAEASS